MELDSVEEKDSTWEHTVATDDNDTVSSGSESLDLGDMWAWLP